MANFLKGTSKIALTLVVVLGIFSNTALAATLSIVPSTATYSVGQSFAVRILVSSSESINAISGRAIFPTNLFTIQSISKANSVLNFWITEPSFSRESGTVFFEGVALSGFVGQGGTVLTVNLLAKGVGSGQTSFQSIQILANDGLGTDVTSNLNPATLTIEEASSQAIVPIAPGAIEEEPEALEEPTPTPSAPGISISKLDNQTIHGLSQYESSEVILTLLLGDGSKIFLISTTDDSGQFTFVIPEALREESFFASALVVLEDGSHSSPSNTLQIEGGLYKVIKYGQLYVYTSFLFGLILLGIGTYVVIKHFVIAKRRRIAPQITINETH